MGLIIGVGNNKPVYPHDHFYGIEWDVTVSNPVCKRIGKVELHRQLPIQSRMARVILKDNGEVSYKLHPNDSTKQDNGASAKLDGTDGQVMVLLPKFYYKVEMEGNIRRVMISDYQLPGFILSPECYTSAYEASLNRTTSTLASVVNATVEYRGGNNNAELDETDKTLLGRPASQLSLDTSRSYSKERGAGWFAQIYSAYKKMYWLYFIEYANFNCQLAFTAEPTSEGFKQGGLSEGVTTLTSASWSSFNGYYPFIPCGHTNSLGNKTGTIEFEMPESYGSKLTVEVPSYRGVENPFGHIWKTMDGCKFYANSDADGGESEFYVADSLKNLNSSNSKEGYTLKGICPRSEGYIKELILGEGGEIMPLAVGAGTTTYHCDYFYTNAKTSHGLRQVLFGGSSFYGSNAGLSCSITYYAPSYAGTTLGSRLCFMGVE